MDRRALTAIAVSVALLLGGCEPEPDTVILNCTAAANQQTDVQIQGPAANAQLGAGTELTWVRTGHDLCAEFGTDERYAIAVCANPTPAQCFPSNGFYRANVSPDDLAWSADEPGNYTLSAEDVEAIRTGITPPLADGASVTFQIRYNYDNFSTIYGQWSTRNLTLNLDPPPTEPPAQAPTLDPPDSYGPAGPLTMNWEPVEDASHFRARLVYRAGDPSGSDMGTAIGSADPREFGEAPATFEDAMPAHTSLVVWAVAACNAGGCSDEAIHGVRVSPPVPESPGAEFSTIVAAFRAPSCVNCHAVAATNAEPQDAADYETGDNFGMPPGHPPNQNCTACHTAELTPDGSHPVPWQAAPASMDLRGRSDAELCEIARNPGSLAENIADHLLGDPLILWAVEGGPLPGGAGNTDVAFGPDWETAVVAWIEAGAPCL